MKTLTDYINRTVCKNLWDGHIHLFDHTGTINKDIIDSDYNCVCFADVVFKYEDEYDDGRMVELYDEFISTVYDPEKHILLATGNNFEDILTIYNKYPKEIKGFGELKCYGESVNGKLPYDDLDWVHKVLSYNSKGLPVYIHLDMDNDKHRNDFEDLLNTWNCPIVLCHCGMNDKCDKDDVFKYVKDLQKRYNNLWIDISKSESVDYFLSNIDKLLQLDQNRIIAGTDLNPVVGYSVVIDDPFVYSKNCYDKLKLIRRFVDYTKNIKRLFTRRTA